MSHYASPASTTITTPTPASAVSLDPVTGAVLTTPMPCCSTSSSPSHLHPAAVTTHTASDVYLTALYSLLGVAVAAGVGYAGYRYYTDFYAKKPTAPNKEGIVDKRAAYPVKEVTDERLIDAAIAEAQANQLPVRLLHPTPPHLPLTPPTPSLFLPPALLLRLCRVRGCLCWWRGRATPPLG